MDDITCTVCHGHQVEVFVSVPNVPVLCNILWPTRDSAVSVNRVEIPLAFCSTCGHIFNPRFDISLMDYTEVYENSLHFSAHFQDYANKLAADLVNRHDLHGKRIVEIGSGKGDFLELLCELGDNHGIGFDPSYIPGGTERSRTDQITFIQDFYSEKYASVEADFICCRHTLEHIPDPRNFLRVLRLAIGDRMNMQVFFEVPNALHTIQGLAIWDIIYEHCSYFTPFSLAYLFAEAGFAVSSVTESFSGQFLTIEATPAVGATDFAALHLLGPSKLADDVEHFAIRYREKVAGSRVTIDKLDMAGGTGVIWGAGSKGITFLNVLNPGNTVSHAVDINPRKQGKFITGTGQEIVSPSELRHIAPDVVFVMNPVYMHEIQTMLNDLEVNARCMTF